MIQSARKARVHHAEEALALVDVALSGRLSSYSRPANLLKKPTWPNIGPTNAAWKYTHCIVS